MAAMTLEERIAKAARETYAHGRAQMQNLTKSWEELDTLAREFLLEEASTHIKAAFPELFDGTGWIAPMEPDWDMADAGGWFGDEGMPELTEAWAALRDNYLNRDKKE